MKFYHVNSLNELVKQIEQGETPSKKMVSTARAILDREIAILKKRSKQQEINLMSGREV
tara:strand:+ start:223 stop:399 length:177 start_codon:yes stop_codon:yes gene_type:complete